MIADLHCHYPMHLVEEWARGEGVDRVRAVERMRAIRGRPNKFRAGLLALLNSRINQRTTESGPRVTVERIAAGDMGIVFSVLYSPFAEIDLDRPFQADPLDAYFEDLETHIGLVEEDVGTAAQIVRDAAELDAAQLAGVAAIVHCVEGGFHLGSTPEAVRRNVATLADAGVAYITLAHLFWRGYAKNVNAIPLLPGWLYWLAFGKPRRKVGLSDRAEVAIRAMAERGILVDIAHMHERALAETWEVLDDVAPTMPVVCTHAGYRFGRNAYMLDRDTIERIARREGVVGLIMGQHLLTDGLKKTHTIEDSLDVIGRHIDRIRDITGSYDHVAIGSDLAGFIKPTLAGFENVDDLKKLTPLLAGRYGGDVADKITHGNAERVLRALWTWKATPADQRPVPVA